MLRFSLAVFLLFGSLAELRAVVFAATRVNTTVLQVTGTRTEAVQLIEPVLVSAGWTTISGTGTGDVVLESADPAGAVPAIRMRLYDPGAGNCFRVSFRNVAATQISNDLFLLPGAAKTWRIIANEFQLFIFNTAATTTARNFVAGGVPAVPSFLAPSVAWWGMGDSISDTDATFRATLRVRLGTHRTGYGTPSGQTGTHACNWNGVLLNGFGSGNTFAAIRIIAPWDTYMSTSVVPQFADDTFMVSDAWIGWGLAGDLDSSAHRITGLVYDSIVVAGNVSADTTITFNGNSYYVVTQGAAPVNGLGNASVLAVRIP